MTASFTASVFIATSLDGYIAREDGSLDWLLGSGPEMADTGYNEFFAPIDAMVIGRGTYEVVKDFDPWPYTGKRVLVLSRTLEQLPQPETSVRHDLTDVVETLEREGRSQIYVDGGQTIMEFLRAGLVHDLTINVAPVLIGSGIRLFGHLPSDIALTLTGVKDLGSGFTQATYEVVRS